ncbi:glycosyltransferase family 2 protein [Lacinutrix iliipiscaria]
MAKEKDIPLEILVATMNRNSLQFLYAMFKYNDIRNYTILVVNQTTEDCLLESNNSQVRVINTFEKGLSRSRNLAIQKAIGRICLIADDDVIFQKNFQQNIISSYEKVPEADLITFKTLTTQGNPYSNYPKTISKLTSFYKKVLSIEITFKRESLIKYGISFDEDFGLGSVFQDGENRLFLKRVINHKDLKAYFVPEFIVEHESNSSSDQVSSDRFISARSALNYKLNGNLAYFYSAKLIASLLRKGLIRPNQIASKWSVVQEAIKTYKLRNA